MKKYLNKIGKQNFILIIFIFITLLITELYQTFSLYTESTGINIIDEIKTYNFILNANNTTNSITIAKGNSKNIAITIANDSDTNLIYSLYYSSSSNLTNVNIGYLSNTTNLPNGIIKNNTNHIVTIKIDNNSSNDVTIDFNIYYGFENAGELILNNDQFKLNEYIEDIPSKPNLDNNNLIPVYYDDNEQVWKIASNTNVNNSWYNYDDNMWANAIIPKETINIEENTVIDISKDVIAMFVWIPRYEYQITNDTNEIFINFISNEITIPSDGYIIHPAFTFGTTEVNGIWVGKFETSTSTDSTCYTNPTLNNCNNTDLDIFILPNVKALTEQTISTQFTLAQTLNDYLSDYDSHMLKNSEWSAVAYLSQSRCGKYGNNNYSASNKEIYINNSDNLYTGRSSGSNTYIDSSQTMYEYNYGFKNNKLIREENGVGASTTGNITGIYDMNGGAYEYLMGYLSTASSTFGATSEYDYAGFDTAPDSKYYDNYTTETSNTACNNQLCYGHGFEETAGWYNDEATFLTYTNPWIMRGGVFDGDTISGIFSYSGTLGYSGAFATFRVALTENN